MVDSEEKAPGKPKRRKKSTRRKKAGTPHDASYKRFFSSPVMVRELLEGFIAGEWLKRLDLRSLEPVPKSFVSHTSRQRHSDVIWRVRSR
ncbi:MAG: Rpn family recombination-promoting nuclease/putative transposase, partial [bacterium]|nr:Rpn family recombination-promoting nuclease/putative transposase [bacterium]